MSAPLHDILPSTSRHWDAVIPFVGKPNRSALGVQHFLLPFLFAPRLFPETASPASDTELMMMSPRHKNSGDGTDQIKRQQRVRPRRQSRSEIPTRDYAALVAVFNGLLATALLARKCSREPLPERVEPKDLALFALATQKLSRVITKDKVTSAFRAPFTEVEGKGGPGEIEERAKGHGLRRAIGELLTCPFCLGTWIASGFIYGYVFAPRISRTLASIFAVSGLADFLQQLYVKTQDLNK